MDDYKDRDSNENSENNEIENSSNTDNSRGEDIENTEEGIQSSNNEDDYERDNYDQRSDNYSDQNYDSNHEDYRDGQNEEDYDRNLYGNETFGGPPEGVYEPSPKKRSYPSYVIVAVVSAIIGAILGSLFFTTIYKAGGTNGIKATPQNVTIKPTDKVTTAEAVAKKAEASVVGIVATETVQNFWQSEDVEGVGSGVVVGEEGYILTNSHVIYNGSAEKINVLFSDGEELKGKMIWNDESMDLAIVKVETKKDLKVAELGDSDELTIGQVSIAIGNPLGLDFERTVTQGIVSGLNRSLTVDEYNTMDGLIQTDASINAGNSGGPLLDKEGKVIGLNTLKISSGEGLGFAIPINTAKPIVEEVIKTGDYSQGYIGIEGMDVARYQVATGTNLGMDKGVYVAKVTDGSPAEKAGLKVGDVITSIDDEDVDTFKTLKKVLYKYKPNDELKANISRDGKKDTIKIKLEEMPKE